LICYRTVDEQVEMASSEKFCLKWNDFESNVSFAFRELRDDRDFFDVTLACEEEQISAHKVILSACSPFFKNLLRKNPHQHPLLYLKGISFKEIQSVLNFMYHGEANIAQDDLNNFLAVAEDLKVKGLTQGNSDSSANNSSSRSKVEPSKPAKDRTSSTFRKPVAAQSSSVSAMEDDDIQEVASVPIKQEMETIKTQPGAAAGYQNYTEVGDTALTTAGAEYGEEQYYEEYDESYNEDYGAQGTLGTVDKGDRVELSHDQLDEYINQNLSHDNVHWVCNICSKPGKKRLDVSRHIEAKHVVMAPLICSLCNNPFKTRDSLRKHMAKSHASHC